MSSLKSFVEEEQELRNDQERELGGHPEVEEILKYSQGELASDGVTRLQNHFYHCHTCRNLYLSLVRPSAFEDKALQDAWERFQATLSR